MSDDKFAAPTKSDLESGTAMASITTDARPRSSAEHKLDDKEVHDLHVEVTEHAPTKKPRSFWFVLVSLMLGLFLATLDVTVVSTGWYSFGLAGAWAADHRPSSPHFRHPGASSLG